MIVREKDKILHYDLILVYTSHRRHEIYLNIIKYLSMRLSIGIYRCETKRKRWGKTEEEYLQTCLELGASFVDGKAECHTLMLSRFGGEPGSGNFKDILEDMPDYIKFGKILIWTAGIFHGILKIKEICQYLGEPTILVPSKRYFAAIEPETKEFLKQHPLKVVEVGLPYAKYPIFEDFSTDYILAYPSHVSIKNLYQHYQMLKKMISVLKCLPKNSKIMVKPHNVIDTGNYLSRTYFVKYRMPNWLLGLMLTLINMADLKWKGKCLYKVLPEKIMKIIYIIHNDYIFQRCNNLLDSYPAFGIEHFMHGVKRGVITGLSATIIYAMFEGKAVCICDSVSGNHSESYRLMDKFFGINNRKGFSERGFDAFDNSNRNADLIEYLLNTVERNEKISKQ